MKRTKVKKIKDALEIKMDSGVSRQLDEIADSFDDTLRGFDPDYY